MKVKTQKILYVIYGVLIGIFTLCLLAFLGYCSIEYGIGGTLFIMFLASPILIPSLIALGLLWWFYFAKRFKLKTKIKALTILIAIIAVIFLTISPIDYGL